MFFLAKYNHASMNVAEPEFYEVELDLAVKNGQALTLDGRVLSSVASGEKPQFISMVSLDANAKERRIPCVRVNENQLWRVPVSEDPTALRPGFKVTIGDDRLSVTATTAGGVITVADLNGAEKAGDEIYVRIV